MIEAEIALKPDTELELEMRLGRRKFSSSGRVIYLAEIALQEGDLRYRMGVEFLRIAEGKQRVLEEFIRKEMKKTSKKGAAGRVAEKGRDSG